MMIRYLIGIFTLLFCIAAKNMGLSKLEKGIYEEDLSYYRTEFYKTKKEKKEPVGNFTLQGDQAAFLAKLLIKRKLAYEAIPYVKGFTLQIYMGNSRKTALKMQACAAALQTIYVPRLHYKQPNYRVQLGFFTERLEAYFVYLTIVKALPGAMLRPFMLPREAYVTLLQNHDKTVC